MINANKLILSELAVEIKIFKKNFGQNTCGNKKLVVTLHSQTRKNNDILNRESENAKIAQLVEHDLAMVGVAGSSPVFRSMILFIGSHGMPVVER